MPTVSAADNPALVNDMIAQVMASVPEEAEAKPEVVVEVAPDDLVFDLPGGYVSPFGEVSREVEVRELTGRDEEAIAKASGLAKAISTILSRGVVRIGDAPPTETTLDGLLTGDRDYLLMRIFAATFGPSVISYRACQSCGTESEISVDVIKDVEVKRLDEPGDRYFIVPTRKGEAKVELPTGVTQKKILASTDKTVAELSTILLANTVSMIGSNPVLGPNDILDLSIKDRRKIAEEIAKRTPGPNLQEVRVQCPSCDADMEVAVSLTSLFQF